jgi:predicted Zn-dependent protease
MMARFEEREVHVRRLAGWTGLAALVVVLPGCQTVDTTQGGVVGVQRDQRMLLSSAQVNQSAEKAYGDVIGKARSSGALNSNPAQVERVRRIAQRLIAQTGAFRTDAQGWRWESNVIASRDVNAWCMPGGKMAVYTGLLERLQPSDDELAAVMGHEIAHALREHGRERASQAMAQSIGVGVIGALLGVSGTTRDLSQALLDVTINLPNSRTHEVEADRIGVELAARAGFDPHAAISLWEKMQKIGGGQPPQFLSTHPSHESRIADLRVMADRVAPLYNAARR